jgi:hypothetical protein
VASNASVNFGWDGLGFLYHTEFLPAPQIFYCPSHSGRHRFDDVRLAWRDQYGDIPINYHYRGEGPMGTLRLPNGELAMTTQLFRIDPAQSSLIADGMRSQSDVNHKTGANFFRADLTVHWFADSGRQLIGSVAVDGSDSSPQAVSSLWSMFDTAANSGTTSIASPGGPP